MGDARKDALRVEFDSRIKLEFHGAAVTSDAGLVAYRELDEVLVYPRRLGRTPLPQVWTVTMASFIRGWSSAICQMENPRVLRLGHTGPGADVIGERSAAPWTHPRRAS